MLMPEAAADAIPAEPKRRRKRDAEILDAAVRVFCERGYAAATIQDVAEVVDMLKGSLYYYFPSKEQLLFRILGDAHDQVLEIFDEILALDVTPIERLRAFLERHLNWYLTNLELARVTFHEWKNLTGDLLDEQTERRRSYDEFVRNLIRACQRAGDINPDLNITYAANYLLGAINAVPDWYRRDGRDPASTVAHIYADLTLVMLTNAGPTPKRRPRAASARRNRA